MATKEKGYFPRRVRKQKSRLPRILGFFVLDDDKPSDKSVNIIADRIKDNVNPKYRLVVEQAKQDVLDRAP